MPHNSSQRRLGRKIAGLPSQVFHSRDPKGRHWLERVFFTADTVAEKLIGKKSFHGYFKALKSPLEDVKQFSVRYDDEVPGDISLSFQSALK